MEEIWKIISYAQNYSISNFGRVKNNKTNLIRKTVKSEAYERISIKCDDGKVHTKRIHRLVLEAFDPKPNMNELVVNHKDGNHFNNRLDNLEWTTQSENVRLTWARGRKNYNGENNDNSIEYKDEVWVVAADYKNYLVSNYARIKNKQTNYILNTNEINKYLWAALQGKDGKSHKLSVHRLVMNSFYPREDARKLQINHIDGNKHNNKLSNLEWCTGSENMMHCKHVLGK